MAKKRDDDADGVDNPMYTMSKVGGGGGRGMGDFKKWGYVFEMGGFDTPLCTMVI